MTFLCRICLFITKPAKKLQSVFYNFVVVLSLPEWNVNMSQTFSSNFIVFFYEIVIQFYKI